MDVLGYDGIQFESISIWLVIMSVYVTSLGSARGNSLLSATLGVAIQARSNDPVAIAKPFSVDLVGSTQKGDLAKLELLGLTVLQQQIVINEIDGSLVTKSTAMEELTDQINGYSGIVVMDGVSVGDIGYGDVTRILSVQIVRSTNSRVVGIIDVGCDSDSWDPYIGLANELGDLFAGVVLNKVPRYRSHWVQSELTPRIQSEGIDVLSIIPESRVLASLSVSQLAELVGGELTYGEQYGDRLVEHLMLGVNVMDSSIPYYQQRANKAVIVRGDRPDLQMGALATDISCLVLTGDTIPAQYIEYEADKVEVPIICTAHGTMDVTDLLSGWTHLGGFSHLGKVEELSSLLDQELFLDKLLTL